MFFENELNNKLYVKRINRILSMLIDYMKNLDDEGRDLPVRWNIMHMYSSSQLAKVLAIKRGLDMELAAIAAALHDFRVVVTKITYKHAELAGDIIEEFIDKYNNEGRKNLPEISDDEKSVIIKAVIYHSDKEKVSEDPMVELIKDVDSFDRYLHGVKSEGAYIDRCRKVVEELNLI